MTWPELLAEADKYVVIPLLAAIGLAVAGWAVRVGNAAVAVLEKKAGLQLTQLQRDSIYSAINTAAGIVKTKIDQGVLKASDISPEHPAIVAEAAVALATVPDATAAQSASIEMAARKIVAIVDTSAKQGIIVPTGPVPPFSASTPRAYTP